MWGGSIWDDVSDGDIDPDANGLFLVNEDLADEIWGDSIEPVERDIDITGFEDEELPF